MSAEADSTPPERDHRAVGVPAAGDSSSSSRRIPLTTMELCGCAMFLVGSGMVFADDEEWWVLLALAGMVVLIFLMGIVQERWMTRERGGPDGSARERTGVRNDSGRSEEKVSGPIPTHRGGKPPESGSSRGAEGEPARLGDGGVSPELPHPPHRTTAGEKATPQASSAEEVPPGEMEKRHAP